MVEETPAVEQPVVDAQAPTAVDPYAFDESKFASFSPEQRASLNPVFSEWKERAKQEVEKTRKSYEEKYKPELEKAQALGQLVQRPEFQQWWASQQQMAMRQNPQGQGAIQNTGPQDIASAEEWQSAISDAYAGDPTKMKALQARTFAVMATPVVQQIKDSQDELRTTMEMKNLFEAHPDAKSLDKIGYDAADPETPSLLETALNLADAKGKSLEWGYQLAKRWSDSLTVAAKQEAMGLVQGKKESITSGPSTNKGGTSTVIEVSDAEELMTRSMEASLAGGPMPKFVIRPPAQVNRDQRWAQRT